MSGSSHQVGKTNLLDPAQIRVVDPSTDVVPDSGPTVASRTCMVVGGLVERAGRTLRNRIVAFGDKRGLTGWPLKEIAGGRHMTLSDMVALIDSERQHGNLSSAIRLFVLDFYRTPRSHDAMLMQEAQDAAAA